MRLPNLHKLRVGKRGVFTITAVAVIIGVLTLYAYMSSLTNALTTYNEAYAVGTYEEIGPGFTVKAIFFGNNSTDVWVANFTDFNSSAPSPITLPNGTVILQQPSYPMDVYINNIYQQALNGFVILQPPPYPIVNKSFFSNTLVTFQLPNNSGYKYATIVVKGGKIYVYEVNSAGNYKLYSVTSKPEKTVIVEVMYPSMGSVTVNMGNYTLPVRVVTRFVAERFEVPLPGSSVEPDPSVKVYFHAYSVYIYVGSFFVANSTAAGWFFIDPGVEVNSIIPDGSAYTYNPAIAICTNDAPGGTYETGSYAAYTYVHAGFALTDCPVTTVFSTWPFVGMDANGTVYVPTSIPFSKSIEAACVCTGASFTFNFPPSSSSS